MKTICFLFFWSVVSTCLGLLVWGVYELYLSCVYDKGLREFVVGMLAFIGLVMLGALFGAAGQYLHPKNKHIK